MNKPYHHGDLRAALVAEALTLVEESNAENISLREVARRVGVSPQAVYRHFPDKAALMAELAQTGLARLAVAQQAASERAGGGSAGFAATGAEYVRFALANPGLFRLIFAHGAAHAGEMCADNPMSMLREASAALAPPGRDPAAFALQAWSIAHGLAMLMLDGQVPVDEALIDRVVDVRALG
ncbi:TetR/AcrR family transcriptional regulator [Sphingoaurantiacus capsulatus]|uniref:TetR/AcrR family transcriptional regulator n=1 Tax=Sphingoaurantiacus capsulatus TaxID=1771310 RepID=A0ABV7XFB8_9SPHN